MTDKQIKNNNNQEDNEKKLRFWGKIFHTPSKYIAISVISIIIILIILINSNFYSLVAYQDAFFVTGFIWIGVSILSLISHDGFFRIFSYSGYYIYNKFLQKPIDNYHDYYLLKEEKREKNKWTWTPYLFSGLILLAVSFIFMIIISLIL